MSLEYVEISSKITRRGNSFDRERIACLRLKKKRKHKKRHAVNEEKSHIARMKANAAKRKLKARAESMRAFRSAACAYWKGTADAHP